MHAKTGTIINGRGQRFIVSHPGHHVKYTNVRTPIAIRVAIIEDHSQMATNGESQSEMRGMKAMSLYGIYLANVR